MTVLSLVAGATLHAAVTGLAQIYGQPLRASLERVLRDYEQRYTLGNHSVPDTQSRDSRTQLEVVAAAVADSGLPVRHAEARTEELAFLARLDRCLSALARAQAYPPRPLLSAAGAGDRQLAGQRESEVTGHA